MLALKRLIAALIVLAMSAGPAMPCCAGAPAVVAGLHAVMHDAGMHDAGAAAPGHAPHADTHDHAAYTGLEHQTVCAQHAACLSAESALQSATKTPVGASVEAPRLVALPDTPAAAALLIAASNQGAGFPPGVQSLPVRLTPVALHTLLLN